MPAIHPIQQDRPAINGRQLCFFVAFVVPVSKLLSAPAQLAEFAKGDLLVPALAQYLLQAAVLAVIMFLASRTDKSFFQLLGDTFGYVTARIVYILSFSVSCPYWTSSASSIRRFSTPRPTCTCLRPSSF